MKKSITCAWDDALFIFGGSLLAGAFLGLLSLALSSSAQAFSAKGNDAMAGFDRPSTSVASAPVRGSLIVPAAAEDTFVLVGSSGAAEDTLLN